MMRNRRWFVMLPAKIILMRSLRWSTGRWDYNVRMILKEIKVKVINWMESAEDINWRVLDNASLNLRVSCHIVS